MVRLLGNQKILTFETFFGYLSCVLLWVLLGVKNKPSVTNKSHENRMRGRVWGASFWRVR